jgi:hypothetical protein
MVFLPLAYGAPDRLAPRLYYLADPAATVRATGTDTLDVALTHLALVARLHVEPYGGFLAAHRDFFVWDPPGPFGWVRQALAMDGVEVETRRDSAAGTLMRARPP